MSTDRTVGLLYLPRELRLEIYEHLREPDLTSGQDVYYVSRHAPVDDETKRKFLRFPVQPIFQVCRAIREEAVSFFWPRAHFKLDVYPELANANHHSKQIEKLFDNTSTEGLARLRHLSIRVLFARIHYHKKAFLQQAYAAIKLNVRPDRQSFECEANLDNRVFCCRGFPGFDRTDEAAASNATQYLSDCMSKKLAYMTRLVSREIRIGAGQTDDGCVATEHVRRAIETLIEYLQRQSRIDREAFDNLLEVERTHDEGYGFFVL